MPHAIARHTLAVPQHSAEILVKLCLTADWLDSFVPSEGALSA